MKGTKSLLENKYVVLSLILVLLIILGLIIQPAVSPSTPTVNVNMKVKPYPSNNTGENTGEVTNNGAQNSGNVNASTGGVESKNETTYPEENPSVTLILNPYEKYKPPVKTVNYKGHYVFAVEYFDADEETCLTLQKNLIEILGKDAVWVRVLNDNYDNKVRHNYITKILLGKYYSYYVVPITAIFIDDKLAIVFTGSWSQDTVEKFIDWYIKNDLVTPGRFLFIDLTEAQSNYGQVTARLINSRVKYNALIDLFLQQGKYQYDRIHILAMNPTS